MNGTSRESRGITLTQLHSFVPNECYSITCHGIARTGSFFEKDKLKPAEAMHFESVAQLETPVDFRAYG